MYAHALASEAECICCIGLAGMLTFFFDRADDFAEIRDFVRDMDARYDLHVQNMHGDFKAGVEHLVNGQGIKAIFLGTRRYWSRIPRLSSISVVAARLDHNVCLLGLFHYLRCRNTHHQRIISNAGRHKANSIPVMSGRDLLQQNDGQHQTCKSKTVLMQGLGIAGYRDLALVHIWY